MQPTTIETAHQRISPYVHRTPLLSSSLLNNWLGHDIVFKAENLQKTGAFKARGAINKLLTLKEQNALPHHVVAFSSGNHAQALAWAGQKFGVKVTICLPETASAIKIQATKSYGANIIISKTRQEAESKTAELVKNGAYLVHAYDDDNIIAGQGTACFEALQDMTDKPDAIFASCGGGGLLSGTFLAKELLLPNTQVFGVEPSLANDASRSYHDGNLHKFDTAPNTIADGARTLCLSDRTFHYIQQLDGFMEVAETDIHYWVQWLSHLLKITIEPTAALAMAGAYQWLKLASNYTTHKTRVLVILSGGNLAKGPMLAHHP
jgi:threonine dehydratase